MLYCIYICEKNVFKINLMILLLQLNLGPTLKMGKFLFDIFVIKGLKFRFLLLNLI